MERRLSAIFAADMVGYSALMEVAHGANVGVSVFATVSGTRIS